MDVISHLPVLCEDLSVPFVFVPSKAELGSAAATKRPTSCVLIPLNAKPGKGGEPFDSADKLKECMEEVSTCLCAQKMPWRLPDHSLHLPSLLSLSSVQVIAITPSR
jgi:hypothetical protein